MKLLLDENLSRRLVPFLQAAYPGSSQVALLGLEQANDDTIWHYAKSNGYVIVTQDADFHERSLLLGAPPQVIWLRLRNPAKSQVLAALLDRQARLEQCLVADALSVVELLP